jgi:hypothetical protein
VGGEEDSGAQAGEAMVAAARASLGGWLAIDLDRLSPIPIGGAAPQASWIGVRPCWRVEAVSTGARKRPRVLAKQPLTIERLAAWAERLRGPDRPGRPESRPAVPEPPAPLPARRAIRPADLVAIRRSRSGELGGSVVPRPLVERPTLQVASRGFRLRGIPSSPAVRFVLLCLAAFFLSAGAVHSYMRCKEARVIVIPASTNPDTIIT